MNKRLITSWLHVILIIALLAIGYATFEGLCFYSGGNFQLAGFATSIIIVIIFFMFIIPQQLKGRDGDFKRMIFFERYFVFILAPLSLLLAAFPISHFIHIQHQETQIATQFTCAIDTARTMFSDYEAYANERMAQYKHVIRHQSRLNRENKMRCLRLQLLSANYDSLHTSATLWIEEYAQKPSTLNVFLLGNLEGIKQAINGWNDQLHQLSDRRMSDEPENTEAIASPSESATAATELLESLKQQFHQISSFSITDMIALLALWLMLMLPYLFQRRHSKSTMRLFGKERNHGVNSFTLHNSDSNHQSFRFTLNNKQK